MKMTDLLLQTASGKQSFRLACAQQIMVRMLFTGYLGERHGEIFQILLEDPESEGTAELRTSPFCPGAF